MLYLAGEGGWRRARLIEAIFYFVAAFYLMTVVVLVLLYFSHVLDVFLFIFRVKCDHVEYQSGFGVAIITASCLGALLALVSAVLVFLYRHRPCIK